MHGTHLSYNMFKCVYVYVVCVSAAHCQEMGNGSVIKGNHLDQWQPQCSIEMSKIHTHIVCAHSIYIISFDSSVYCPYFTFVNCLC